MALSQRKGNTTTFWCPGCDDIHMVSDSWQVTGADESLTISPSVLVYGHKKFINDDLEGDALFAPENITTTPHCHSFVRHGQIEFLGDSTHPLAGQTVPLAPLPTWLISQEAQ